MTLSKDACTLLAVKIDDIEVGQSYAYSASARGLLEGKAVKATVVDIVEERKPHKTATSDTRLVRLPVVKIHGLKTQTCDPRFLHALWDPYETSVAKQRLNEARAKGLDTRVRRALGSLGTKMARGGVQFVGGRPSHLVIEVSLIDGGEEAERIVKALERGQ